MAENDDVFGKDSPWTKERVLEDWDVSLEYARNKLIEKVKGRIAFLEEILSIVKSVGMCKCSYRCNRHWLIFPSYRSRSFTNSRRFPVAQADVPSIRRREVPNCCRGCMDGTRPPR